MIVALTMVGIIKVKMTQKELVEVDLKYQKMGVLKNQASRTSRWI